MMNSSNAIQRMFKSPLRIKDSEHRMAVFTTIKDARISEWCLNLCLLEYDLIHSLIIVDEASSFRLIISRDPSPQPVGGGVQWGKQDIKLHVVHRELTFWLGFFLSYYRDGVADVNHIDAEIPSLRGTKKFYLVLEVGKVRPPLTPEEAKRLYDL
jgi:hypothetical protein